MIYLLEYDPPKGELVLLREFTASERQEAVKSRLALELDLNSKGIKHEVVLLEATDRAALLRTHRRYFESVGQILEHWKNWMGSHGPHRPPPAND